MASTEWSATADCLLVADNSIAHQPLSLHFSRRDVLASFRQADLFINVQFCLNHFLTLLKSIFFKVLRTDKYAQKSRLYSAV